MSAGLGRSGPVRTAQQDRVSAGARGSVEPVATMMNLQQAARWIAGARLIGDASVAVARVHSDTRTLAPGDLFVALSGERFDGNEFLAAAKAAGACAAIAQRGLADAGLSGLEVVDTRLALGQLAQGWRQQFDLPLIAVSGSNGKTTVTQMLAAILSSYRPGRALATQGNLNNDVGLPLTLLRLRAQHAIAVLELGMNHVGEIAYLAHLAAPTVALVNNAQREHLEFMRDVEAVAQENGSVITALPDHGRVVIPAADAFNGLWRRLADGRPVLSFGLAADASAAVEPADVVATEYRWSGESWQVQVRTPQGELGYRLGVAGQHNLRNSLAAVACALAAGVPAAAICEGLSGFRAVRGRSSVQTLQLSGRLLTLVDDSYNANPDSVRAAIDLLATLPGPRLLVLGDMAEVGTEGAALHAEIGAYAKERGIEFLCCLGSLSAHSARAFGVESRFDDVEALIGAVLQRLPEVASLLVKGSRSMKMERVSEAIPRLATAAAVSC